MLSRPKDEYEYITLGRTECLILFYTINIMNAPNKLLGWGVSPMKGSLPLILFLLVDKVDFRSANVDDFRATVPILFQNCTFKTVECIRNSRATTNNAFSLRES